MREEEDQDDQEKSLFIVSRWRIYAYTGVRVRWPGEVSDPSVRMTAVTIVTMVTPSWPGADVPIIIITLSPAPHNHHQYKHIKSCPISNNMVVMEPCYPGYCTTDLRSDSDKMRRRQLRYTDQPTRTFPSLTQFLSPLLSQAATLRYIIYSFLSIIFCAFNQSGPKSR